MGAILTVLVVFLFLNSWRSTVITGLALPVSVLASFIAVWALGFKLETMSLLGLSLAIGILIDDAIVVRENIVRHVEMGKDHYTAAREGTDEIGLAVAATTFSILAVFVPDRLHARHRRPVVQAVRAHDRLLGAVSLFVSFSLDPMLSAYWPDPHLRGAREGVDHEEARPVQRVVQPAGGELQAASSRGRSTTASAMMLIAVRTFFASFTLPASGFSGLAVAVAGHGADGARADEQALRRWSRAALVVPGARRASFAFAPIAARTIGKSARRSSPRTTGRSSSSRSRRRRGRTWSTRASRRRRRCGSSRAHPEVLYTYTTLGGGASGAVDDGNIYVRTRRQGDRDVSVEELARTLRGELARVAGVTLSIFTSDFGGGCKQLQVQLRGNDLGRSTRPRPGCATRSRRSPARWTSACRRRGRSRSSTSSSTAASPARWASPSGRWRSRCVRRSPASTPATGRIRPARRATCGCASRPRRGSAPSDLAQIPLVVMGAERRADARCRWARSPTSPRASARRSSTTSTASRS